MSGGVPAGELLPCPFCNTCSPTVWLYREDRKPPVEPQWVAHCKGCNITQKRRRADHAVTAWNTRATPAGWVLVPVEPTTEMTEAGEDAITYPADDFIRNRADTVWSAMIAATPTTQPSRDADVELVREALERSITALNDWLHVYAPEFCGEDHVAESRARIGAYGTLAYIAHVQEKNRAALQALGERG